MSLRRKTYDGDLSGGRIGFAERGSPFDTESKIDKHAPSKRAAKNLSDISYEESPFSESSDKDRYLITYADLITLLLGLFIILYTISNVDISKYEKMITAMGNVFGNAPQFIQFPSSLPGVKNLEPQNTVKNELLKLIEDNHYDSSIRLEENARGITIHILEDILFPSGTADLSPDSKILLDKLAVILKELPNDIRIEGHTDNIPINSALYPSNWHLSVARALNTAYYLIQNQELSPDKVSIVGYSEYKPIAKNSTPEGREQNRRVDIVILTK